MKPLLIALFLAASALTANAQTAPDTLRSPAALAKQLDEAETLNAMRYRALQKQLDLMVEIIGNQTVTINTQRRMIDTLYNVPIVRYQLKQQRGQIKISTKPQ